MVAVGFGGPSQGLVLLMVGRSARPLMSCSGYGIPMSGYEIQSFPSTVLVRLWYYGWSGCTIVGYDSYSMYVRSCVPS